MSKLVLEKKSRETLPKGWTFATIHEMIDHTGLFVDGDWVETKDQDPNGDVRLTQLADIGVDVFKNKSNRFMTTSKTKKLNCTILQNGDILIARMPDPLGRACIFPGDKLPCVTVVDVVIVRTGDNGVDSKWLMYAVNSPQIYNKIMSLQKGTTRKRISRKNLGKINFVTPPLKEQKRIVSKIEELFSKIEHVLENLKHIQTQSEYYFRSFLKDVFSGKITKQWRGFHKDNSSSIENLLNSIREENKNKIKLKSIPEKPANFSIPSEWKFALSNDLLIFVTSGSRDWAKYYDDNGALFLRVTNLDHNSIKLDLSKTKRVNSPKNSEGRRTLVSKNDILISITADVEMVGIVPSNFEEAYVNQHISLARPHPRLNPIFLAWFLNSPEGGQLQFQKLQRGMIKSGLGLNDIRSIWVPFPSLKEQETIVNEIELQFSNLQQNKILVNMMIRQLEELQKSVLKQAFEGKLVTQDPNDEPAEILLQKIKQEKEKLEQKQKIIKAKSQKKMRKNVK